MVINQIHSIGDILFCEPIFRHFWEKNGEKPIVPVRDHLMWMADYVDSARFVPMSQFNLDYDSMETENPDYLPLRFANQIVRGLDKDDHSDYENCMLDKYVLAGLPPDKWKEINMNIILDLEKSFRLAEILGINIWFREDRKEWRCDTKFILVNENCQAGHVEINPENPEELKIIKMSEIEGFTLIDWALIIHLACENRHVSTSTFFLMELMKVISPVFIYPRPNEDGVRGISNLNPSFNYTVVQ